MLPKKIPITGPGPSPARVERVKALLSKLAAEDLEAIDHELHRLLEAAKEISVEKKPGRQVLKQDRVRSVVYQLEYVKCGKEKCRCAQGKGHGPYWYAYYRSPRTGRVVSKYCGKEKKEIKPR